MSENKSLMSLVRDHYKLDEDLLKNGGELSEELEQFMQITEKGLSEKIDSYKLYMDHLAFRAEYFDNLAKQAEQYKKVFDNQIKRMKENIKFAMRNMNTTELRGEQYRFALTEPTDKLVIENEEAIPAMFTKEELVLKLDREAIMNELKKGEQVPGAKIELTQQLRQYVNSNSKKKKPKEVTEVKNENQ
jgi:hypothetical protein